jgi:Tfp pilus assembly PilM family ATPase
MMRFFKSRFSPIGIDVGAASIKAMQVSHLPGGKFRIEAAATIPHASADGKMDAAAVARLTDVLARQGFRGHRVVLAASSSKLTVEVLDLPPRASGAPIDQLARVELVRLAKLESDPFESASWDLPAPARGGSGTALMAVAAKVADTEPLYRMFESRGLYVESIDVPACAVARAAHWRIDPAAMTAVLDLGHSRAGLYMLHAGTVVFQRGLSNSGVHPLKADLAKRLQVDAEVAEHLLNETAIAETAENPRPIDAVKTVVARYADSLASELNSTLSYVGHRYPQSNLETMLLIGGGSRLGGLQPLLGEQLGMKVEPLVSGAAAAACAPHIAGRCVDGLMTMALGLALYDGGQS